MNDLLLMIPEWFRGIIEYPEIMKAWAYALNQVDWNIKKLWDNQYIQTCDEATIAQYERLLGITPGGDDTLEYRRAIVLNKFSMLVPFTEGFLRSRLDEMYGEGNYDLTIDPQTSKALLVIKTTVPRALEIFFDLWYGIAPAHIEIDAAQAVNTVIEGNQYFGGVCVSSVTNRF